MKTIIVSILVVMLCATEVYAVGKKKLFPKFSDPVLGDRAAVIEWAWSPQYAKRFGLPVQKDGLSDGPLWLVGIKIQRLQYKEHQRYRCSILGLMKNNTPILTPPGDIFLDHPFNVWIGGFPGQPRGADAPFVVKAGGLREYTPGQSAWRKTAKGKSEPTKPASGITVHYLYYYRYYLPDLAFFELDGGCAYFKDPDGFRNVISFAVPEKRRRPYSFSPNAMKFNIPDDLIRRIFTYTSKAASWSSCY
jgi:hypothetical protein